MPGSKKKTSKGRKTQKSKPRARKLKMTGSMAKAYKEQQAMQKEIDRLAKEIDKIQRPVNELHVKRDELVQKQQSKLWEVVSCDNMLPILRALKGWEFTNQDHHLRARIPYDTAHPVFKLPTHHQRVGYPPATVTYTTDGAAIRFDWMEDRLVGPCGSQRAICVCVQYTPRAGTVKILKEKKLTTLLQAVVAERKAFLKRMTEQVTCMLKGKEPPPQQ